MSHSWNVSENYDTLRVIDIGWGLNPQLLPALKGLRGLWLLLYEVLACKKKRGFTKYRWGISIDN